MLVLRTQSVEKGKGAHVHARKLGVGFGGGNRSTDRTGIHAHALAHEILKAFHPCRVGVQARHELHLFASMLLEHLLVFFANLNQGLEAVGDERWAEHEELLVASLAPLNNDVVAERAQPLAVQAALEAHRVAILGETQTVGEARLVA